MAKKHSSPIEAEIDRDVDAVPDESAQAARGSRVAQVRRRVFRPAWLLFLALIAAGVLVGPQLVERLPDLTQREEYRLRAENIHLNTLPHWVPHDIIDQVAELERWDHQPISLLESTCCEDIVQAFGRHPWVKQVNRVRLRAGARVELEVTFRRPVAMVETGSGKYYPIDSDAVLLPPADFSRADIARYPNITNPSSLPQGPAGTYWGDLMILGAARVAAHLEHPHDEKNSHWEHLNLASIQLPPRTKAEVKIDEIHFQLITRDGSRILWGRAPGTDHPGELTAEQKIGRLTQYLADFGTFRPPHGPLEIDIRHWQEITQRRLSALETRSRQ